jgi:hypothetical protein
MRLRLLRVSDRAPRPAELRGAEVPGPEAIDVHEVIGAGPIGEGADAPPPPSGERLDAMAQRYYGDPSAWRLIAELNEIDDPLHLAAGAALRIPRREGA